MIPKDQSNFQFSTLNFQLKKMNTTLKKLSPYLLILLGLLILFIIGKAEVAGVCLLLGVVMIILRIWPEKWGAEE